MAEFNLDEWLKTDEGRASIENLQITPRPNGHRPPPQMDEPPPTSPDHYGMPRDEPERTRTANVISLKSSSGAPVVPPLNEWDAGDDTGPIPPRGWLLGNQFCRKAVSSLIAPGATGKSALRMLQYLSVATGRKLTGQHVFQRGRVLLLNFEDDDEELCRRIAAACKHHQIDRDEIKGWLYCASPKGLKLAEIAANKARKVGPLETALRAAIDRRKPALVALDPFVKMHGLEENDNSAMDYVCDLLAKIAIDHNVCIDFPHHSRKGALGAGDSDNGRGASSIRDACRLVYTLTTMSVDEAKTFNISESGRKSYIRLDSAKVNIAPSAQEATWFKLVGVQLENGTDEYPAGDEVQTVAPWLPPNTWAGTTVESLNAILDEIDVGLSNGQRYSAESAARERHAWKVVQRHHPDKSENDCRDMIKKWLQTGTLLKEEYPDPVRREKAVGLRVDSEKRPGKSLPD